jgi:hypothetical protein
MEYLSTDDKIAGYSGGRNRKYAKNSPRCYPTQAQIVVTRRLMENLGLITPKPFVVSLSNHIYV